MKKSVIASAMKVLVMAFFVWFSYDACVEKELVTSTSESSTSEKVMRLSFLVYFPLFFR